MIGRDFDYEREGAERSWRRKGAGNAASANALPLPPFGGDEQFENAATCAAVVERLDAELPVSDVALAAGIRHAYLRGRFERHSVDGVEWVFDVAHNPAAARILTSSLARWPCAGKTFAVFAAMRDKDLSGVVVPFVEAVECWFVTQANAERGATGPELRDILVECGARRVEPVADVAAATAAARALAQRGDRVLVFGSFHTVGAASAALGLYCAPSRSGDRPSTWTRA